MEKSFLSSRDSGRTEYTLSQRQSNSQTRCVSLLKPLLIWKVLVILVIIILCIVDWTSEDSTYSCQHVNQYKGSDLVAVCSKTFLSVGITISIMVIQLVVSIPRFPFLLIAIGRVLQVTGILIVKVTIQQQLYYQFISDNFSPAYYGFALLCGLVLGDVIADKRGTERKHKIFVIVFISVMSFGLMLAEILVNKYQSDLLLLDLVLIFGPVGLFLMVFNTILFNCFTTVLEHSLDLHTVAMVIISAPLTYILVGISKLTPEMITCIGIIISSVLMYFFTFAAWSLTIPKVQVKAGPATLNTVQVVKIHRAPSRSDTGI